MYASATEMIFERSGISVSGRPVGISLTVDPLVMVANDLRDPAVVLDPDLPDQELSPFRMLFDQPALL